MDPLRARELRVTFEGSSVDEVQEEEESPEDNGSRDDSNISNAQQDERS